ncbi:unnamed protein product [Blepharisma stoltei]|uniref:Uncharacterized protein n=1 Tax=Blepharisma stoltei TaxID=1481888 RepID=A0AAU9J7I3_9CILI|nr:unnamed protein product [Blepharisma stoltei]
MLISFPKSRKLIIFICMSQNLPSRRSQEFSSQDSNSTLTAKWLLVSFFNCDLPRDIINEAMRNVSPKPSKWMVAREMNLPESWTICVLVEYEREMTIDSHIFNFFGE